jgi:hypothetical protein
MVNSLELINSAADYLINGSYICDYLNDGLYPKTKVGILDYIKKEKIANYAGGSFLNCLADYSKEGFRVWGDGDEIYLKYKSIVDVAYLKLIDKGVIDMENKIQTSENLDYYSDKIKKKITDIANDFFSIGYWLWEIKHFNHAAEKGYKDVYEYAEKELSFKKISTHNFIAIVDKYADWSQGSYPKMWIAEKYKSFGYSQLTEMLSLAPDHREKVNPDMTIKEIRELKKQVKKELDEQYPTNDKVIDVEFKVDLVEEVIEVSQVKEIKKSVASDDSPFFTSEQLKFICALVKNENQNCDWLLTSGDMNFQRKLKLEDRLRISQQIIDVLKFWNVEEYELT